MTEIAIDRAAQAELPAAHTRTVVLKRLWRHRSFRLGAVVLALIVLAAVCAPWLSKGDPMAMQIANRFHAPSWDYPFGADQYGRDVFTRVLYGARLSLWIGFMVSILAAIGGAVIGMAAGYFSWLDSLLMRIMDALLAFPAILLAIGINAVLGPQIHSVIIALASAYIPRTARIVRASVLVIRRLDYVDAARISGAGAWRILTRHIFPNTLAPLLVSLTFIFAYAILAEATLSFLGIGPPPPMPSWGNIISEGRDYAVEAWWIMLFPGLAISLSALAINLLGDGLRDVLDPRLKVEGN
ncbi:ABC transporter permease [Bordetella hinzii]|uniref:ABC transporter permease n=1 Tax=Bordetella hinzii TaxID=103855 RepID=A0AAN1VHD5_9BORD|nr:ABC transporter permease [Bordetella hinzii]AKQ55844.1 putative D,D-dipeptide transport system permease protein DdpC [Bordetella hinzii]AKQ60376.1 putative D,D-dipeptide transport system permease protein DdpC [Bordetella hinzii]AZW18565.1 ABC transporter permease [Bordetella hinzii]KCB25177.1 ABC transporter, permease protein [Bordetella hinzii L60]KCB46071.1 ABC transporter, permease protein [Bordetella hinzii 4161]